MAPGVTGPSAEADLPLPPAHGAGRAGAAARRLRLELDRPAGAPRGRLRAGVLRNHRGPPRRRPFQRDGGPPPGAADVGCRPGGRGHRLLFHIRGDGERRDVRGGNPGLHRLDPVSWNMDPGLLEEELAAAAKRGKLPKAVIVVDLYGQCADYDPILETCARYGVPVVEDAAEALGASYQGKPAGSFGKIGGVLLQREQDHHDIRGRNARFRGRGTGREGPVPGDRRRGTRRRITSTARSATTTG